jgi:S1-C subfamily serine protease
MSDEAEKINDEEMTNEDHHIFDLFLGGSMSEAEHSAFEERLISDARLRKAFEEYRDLCRTIRDASEYDALGSKLDALHEEFNPTTKIFFLRPRVLWATGIAAGLVIALMVVNPFETGNKSEVAAVDQEYRELGAEDSDAVTSSEEDAGAEDASMEAIEMVDRELIDSMIPTRVRRPIGTCFMISSNGYFLTSKHLVEDKNIFVAQHRETQQTFEVKTVYRDSLLDFAILKCHERISENFSAVPFKFYKTKLELGEEVFTLGYPKEDIVYTKGDVSSETGYMSDSNFVEISLPANPGFSGAPLFTENGDLAGIITANNSKKQSVTYVLKHDYIFDKIAELEELDSLDCDLSRNYSKRFSQKSGLIRNLRPYIFELH